MAQFKTAVDTLIARLKAVRRETGETDILIPRERSYRQRERHLAEGFYLADALADQLTTSNSGRKT